MSLAKYLVVPLVAVVGVGAYMWTQGYRGPDGVVEKYLEKFGLNNSSSAKESAPAPIDPLGPTEGRWMVDEVTRDIAEIVLFASDSNADFSHGVELTVRRKTYGDAYEVTATGPKGAVTQTVTLKHHVWSPADHLPWAAAVLKAWLSEPPPDSSSATPDADGVALAMQLTDPTSPVIAKEERRVSRLLTKRPLDPELHEQAALVIGTLALREAAGAFTDVRPALCRMAAHLTLARALRPEPGTCGKLAEAVQLTLATRQAEALERVAKLPAGLDPWVTALKMRNTGDWRICQNPEKATFLEQLTWARVISQAVSPAPLQAFLRKHLPQNSAPDWSRATMNTEFGVEQGHVFVKPSMSLEVADFGAASQAWDGRAPKGEELLSFLNEPVTRSVARSASGYELTVLGWGHIAAFHQRHICWALDRTDHFLHSLWGVPDQAIALEQVIHAQFSHLRLYPLLVRRMMSGGAGQFLPEPVLADAMRKATALCREQPHLVSSANWALLASSAKQFMPEPPPPAHGWFQPSMPEGTAFDFDHRMQALRLPALPPGGKDYHSFWKRMLTQAPYDYDILRSHIAGNPGTLPPFERDTQAFKSVSEFNVHAMRKIASCVRNDPKAFASAMNLVCALDPDEYLTVAKILADAGHKEEAAVAYQAAFDKASDRVAMSNSSDWIVNYYFDQGRKDDALKIAAHAAEVYSARGLETAAKLMERMEKWEEARAYYEASTERYNAPGGLLQFASRRKEHDPAMAQLYERMMGVQFPSGMRKVTMADFNTVPEKGVAFTGESYHTRQWKLKVGDVIVALDGVLVETFPQYDVVRCLQPGSTPLALIIWDGTQYREVAATVPDRRFGCGMNSYRR
ncbi:hypothetical protein DES53_105218 [Roseimicrobium gellanilyticum]|uniref:PDZ domain-containing protein n=1 Tax=Roseimicrobium gellanilyticum TaxID=748857 RepID=A0A366HLK3_9BACT|nr:hypothetical protein [Roseimicrobium gellanilyticum]RBP43819.1 hypothetical protein DES53_105218 [Roseimicrobium gellanilyticum]